MLDFATLLQQSKRPGINTDMTFNNFEMDSKIVLWFIISELANETELMKDVHIYLSLKELLPCLWWLRFF